MDVRKFEAFSMQDAIKMVKKELGRDAVILNTREVNTVAPGTLTPCKLYEVTAAPSVSRSQSQVSAGQAACLQSAMNRPLSSAVVSGASNVRPAVFPRISNGNEAQVIKSSLAMPTLKNETMRTVAQNRNNNSENSDSKFQAPRERLLSGDAHLNRLPSLSPELGELRNEIGRMKRDIESLPHVNVSEQMQELKVLLHDLMRNRQSNGTSHFHEYLTDLGIRLRAGGVTESVISELLQILSGLKIEDSEGKSLSGARLKEFYLNQAVRHIFKNLKTTGPMRANQQQIICCLVGPTGVGKTTTLVKLAAQFKLVEKKNVALLSMDTFRVAAADQLRVYSKILDCEFKETPEISDVTNYVNNHHNLDAIFIDTAGRSSRYIEQMEGLRRLKDSAIPIHFHLVIAATMKQRDIDENLSAFRFLAPESLMFTKLDESWSFGEILNTAMLGQLPLSYFSTGQAVPEDLEVATKERVIERLFRL